MIYLESNYLTLVRKLLADHIPGKIVWAYGSRVKGTHQTSSDLDLVVIDTLPPEKLSALRAAFSESNLPILVDIVARSDIPDAFKKEIEQEHEVL